MKIRVGSQVKIMLKDGSIYFGTITNIELLCPDIKETSEFNVEAVIYLMDNVCNNSWIDKSGKLYDGYGNACISCCAIEKLYSLH